jgi:hypothetical protein
VERTSTDERCEALWGLGLIALLFEERASFFQQAVSFGLILFR